MNYSFPIIGLAALGLLFAWARPAAAGEVTVTGLDGAQWAGALVGLDTNTVRVATGAEPTTIPLADLAEIAWADCAPRDSANASARFLLNGGGVLNGDLVDGSREQITVRTALADPFVLKYADLAGIVLRGSENPTAAKLYDEAANARLPGHDVLIALDGAEPKALRGRLQSLGPEDGAFIFNNRERTFRTTKVFGVVFALGAPSAPAGAAEVTLASGDRFAGSDLNLAGDGLLVHTTFGADWTIPLAQICTLRWENPRVVYLDALPTAAETSAGILHPAWPIVRNANVMRGPMQLGGKIYARGIGVHARAELTWALGGKYAKFAAAIGLDDAVGAGGNAEFIVLGDGRQLFASGPVSGHDGPQLVRLPVADIDRLTLLVEPGVNADVGDWADWAEARVILPAVQP